MKLRAAILYWANAVVIGTATQPIAFTFNGILLVSLSLLIAYMLYKEGKKDA